MTTIPASAIVNVTPNVLSAGGSALDLVGLMLTRNTRIPIGAVQPFPSLASVISYFGGSSQEASLASIYFLGDDNSALKPGKVYFTQFPAGNVSAYLRGGSMQGTSLATLQSFNGILSVTIDGVLKTGTVDLSTATSFTAAAELIAETIGIVGTTVGSVTGSMGASFTGTGSGTNLTVTAVTGAIHPGVDCVITGTGVPGATHIVSQTSGTPGGAGVYVTSGATTSVSDAIVAVSKTLDVTAVISGAVAVGNEITGSGVTANTTVDALGTGTGGVGTYVTDTAQRVASTTITVNNAGMLYDSTANAFVINSGTAGVASTITYGSDPLGEDLLLTAAAGAVLSQGAGVSTPAAFMNAVTQVTQDWATLMTTFDPDNSGFTNKLAFSAWANGTNDRYAYVAFDTDSSPTVSAPATGSFGYAVSQADYSGTVLIYSPTAAEGANKAAFICGTVGSIDFAQNNGRTDIAFRAQSGLTADVTDQAVADNLLSNGYNFYGSYATANDAFTFFYNGAISGPFNWIDSYVNQIWLNNEFQLALMVLLTQSRSIPYNPAGNAMIDASLNDPIIAGLTFGAIRAGVTLSNAQAAAVNGAAGQIVAPTIQNRGWYLQILPATAQVRAARGSPPCTFWYTDGQSIQKINLTSVNIQ